MYEMFWKPLVILIKNSVSSHLSEAVFHMCSAEKIFLEITQNSQENTCAKVSFLIKLQVLTLQLY